MWLTLYDWCWWVLMMLILVLMLVELILDGLIYDWWEYLRLCGLRGRCDESTSPSPGMMKMRLILLCLALTEIWVMMKIKVDLWSVLLWHETDIISDILCHLHCLKGNFIDGHALSSDWWLALYIGLWVSPYLHWFDFIALVVLSSPQAGGRTAVHFALPLFVEIINLL